MPGKTKRKYIGESMRFYKSLNRPLYLIQEVVPYNYDKHIILNLFQELYPYEWDTIVQRHEIYKAKDEFLIKVGKTKRYYPQEAEEYFFNLQKVKHMTSAEKIKQYNKNHDKEKQVQALEKLRKKRKTVITKRNEKITKSKETIQAVEPLYADIFINEYHRKGITTEGKIEILKELEKYETSKAIEFFYKINDSEKNDQVRKMAFDHLQKIGKYVKLRKKFKGKKKSYMVEKSDFFMKPNDLYARISNDSIQNIKAFDYFISHSLLDDAIVKKIQQSFNSLNYNVYCDWMSDNDFLKRKFISEYTTLVLQKRIEQSKNIVFVRTENTTDTNNNLRSLWIQMELEYAKQLKKKIVCIDFLDKGQCEFEILEYDIKNNILRINKKVNK